jgi:SAM-dependent methyltransferase
MEKNTVNAFLKDNNTLQKEFDIIYNNKYVSKLRDTILDLEESIFIDRNTQGIRVVLRKILSPSSLASRQLYRKKIPTLIKDHSIKKVLVIGSGELRHGLKDSLAALSWIGTDVYLSPTVHVVADIHHLPFLNDSFDLVVCTAVLEHVVEPSIAINEIERVLKMDGLILSEVPFLQQVHEGAYDFYRWNLSGHRFLFKNFQLIDSGILAGPYRVLSWWIKYNFTGVLKPLGFLLRLFLSPILLMETSVLSKKQLKINASSSYLIAKKSDSAQLSHKDLIEFY